MKIEQYISQLLYRHQCVTVPGFGAFLTEIQSAHLHENTNSFYPPKKVISFNSHLKNNDGLLANHIALVYHSNNNDSFSVAEGLQQPFEIIPLAVEEIEAVNSNLKIYPNPTFSGFYISLPITETGNPTYQLSDTSGKIIRQGNIGTLETFVATDNLTSGVYVLKISKASNSYRSYKIMKQ
jgi:hypothetical protein